MKKQLSWHELVIILSMLTMPIAAAINFGAAAYDMLLPRVGVGVALAGGISTGIGFETLGIMAGHYAIAYYGKGDRRWLVAAIIMVAYVAVGTVELWHVPLARFVPLLGAMVYILAGLGQELTATNQQQQSRAQFDLEQEAADNEHRRKLEVRQQELNTQSSLKVQLAHETAQANIAIAAEKAKASIANSKAREAKLKAQGKQAQPGVKVDDVSPKELDLSGNKLEIYTLFQQKPSASNTEIAEMVGVSRQYVGQVKKELNGQMSANGVVK